MVYHIESGTCIMWYADVRHQGAQTRRWCLHYALIGWDAGYASVGGKCKGKFGWTKRQCQEIGADYIGVEAEAASVVAVLCSAR